jgi:bifunctional enzyme CysN/CysC
MAVLHATALTAPGSDQRAEPDLLRFTTAGSVDDGKSTLIGRLLHDTHSVPTDQLEAIDRASRRSGEAYLNLALLTDGLRAEREQNITIDVAYRYFATSKRRFIIADTPGHIQYTRNMVTGASTAELAIVLVDARKGVVTQSKRHGFIASLLRIPHVVLAVNKMDLVGYDHIVFERIVAEYRAFAARLEISDITAIPISALHGDNIVHHSDRLPWYDGATLLHHLENVSTGVTRNLIDFRYPVQYVIRPHPNGRGFAGRIVSGSISAGDDVVVLPSGHGSRVIAIETADGPADTAAAGDSIVLALADDIDVSRGDMIVRRMNVAQVGSRFEATLCWLSETPLDRRTQYVLMHTSRQVRAFVSSVAYRIDVDSLHRDPVDTLSLNDIGRVEITTATPIFFDAYAQNRTTGSFILVDPFTNGTVAAGMIRDVRRAEDVLGAADAPSTVSPGVVWQDWNIPRVEREARAGHRAAVLWFTGLSGAGKSSIARAVERRLFDLHCSTMLLDGDQLRHGLCGDLDFSPADRTENIRRAGEVARLFFEQGSIVLCAFVSPYRADRERVRALVPDGAFLEIHVHCSLEELQRRDPKGLYAGTASGAVRGLTGVSAPYEAPPAPGIRIDTDHVTVEAAADLVLGWLGENRIIGREAES